MWRRTGNALSWNWRRMARAPRCGDKRMEMSWISGRPRRSFSIYIRNDMERYPAFLLCGLLAWICLSSSLLMGANAIVEGGSLLKKVFFPPQVLPMVTVMANFVNFLLGIP